MTEEPTLTADHILDTAEDVLRRFGPSKTTVIDVARALNVSHGTIYRHFPSKAALKDAVAERWLKRVAEPLAEIANENGPAEDRLRRWLQCLVEAKRHKVFDEPELFETYHAIAEQAHGVVDAHVTELTNQLGRIIADGKQEGTFQVSDPEQAGKAIFDATILFHHPTHSNEWSRPGIDHSFKAVLEILLSGLKNTGLSQ